eukprot:2372509-Amphidinium_carterae.1
MVGRNKRTDPIESLLQWARTHLYRELPLCVSRLPIRVNASHSIDIDVKAALLDLSLLNESNQTGFKSRSTTVACLAILKGGLRSRCRGCVGAMAQLLRGILILRPESVNCSSLAAQ